MKEDTVTEDVQNNEEQVASAPGGLTIQDLRVLKMCVEVSSSRGGFQANEMATVGSTYNKLANFLAQVDAQTAAAEEGNEGEEETNDETVTE